MALHTHHQGDRAVSVLYSSARYRIFHAYLSAHASRFSHVLVSDIRDVYFQGDPFGFDGLARTGLYIAQEALHNTIGSCPINSRYLDPYEGNVPPELLRRPITCPGTTLGSTGLMMKYLQRMKDEINKVGAHPRMQRDVSLDQGLHNYVVWAHRWKPNELIISPNGEGPLRTLAYRPAPLRLRALIVRQRAVEQIEWSRV